MAMDFASAVSAYQNAARSAGANPMDQAGSVGGGSEPQTINGKSFGDFVRDGMNEAVRIGHEGEKVSKMAIEGKADLRDVVLAANNAEMTLQTVVSVRDRVVSAYEQIMRMPI
ncbi:MAG: flagellar hook-basal body complex protein FliE [Rhodospirillaceae bacterium]